MDGLKRIAAVVYPGCVALDMTGPVEAFSYVAILNEEEKPGAPPAGYQIDLIGPDSGPVETMSGVKLHADYAISGYAEDADLLIVPGMKSGDTRYRDPDLLAWVCEQAGRSSRVASVCSGAYVLGYAGLLDGHQVTTHWNHGPRLASLFPEATVDDCRIHCKSGNVYSSAGVSAGIDLALAIIEEDFGRKMALRVARRMVVYLKRSGDQMQFSELLSAQSHSKRFEALLDWLEASLSSEITVEILADRCAMSPRNFSRSFKKEIGNSPMQYVMRRRLNLVRLMLEESDLALAQIAEKTGFGTVGRLIAAFNSNFHTSPTEYRKRFR